MEQDLHPEVRGTGERLLLVHGTGSSSRIWDPLVERLAARRTVIAVDLPGLGTSPPLTVSGPPTTPAGFAGIVTAFLKQLEHPTAHIAGNSIRPPSRPSDLGYAK